MSKLALNKPELCARPRRLSYVDADFEQQLESLLASNTVLDSQTAEAVAVIVNDVKMQGDAALLEYTQRFDQRRAGIADIQITAEAMAAAAAGLSPALRTALQQAHDRVYAYHARQRQQSWCYEDAQGCVLGQQISALDRVGIYVPGGQAAYPSSVIMNAVPAKVAGVAEVVMAAPAMRGELNPAILAAAHIAGVDYGFTIGGAQAVAALAYGTESVPAVDKIVGPGNRYVAAAKRMVFGQVGIDLIAGPSEVLIIADAAADPDWLATDLFAQAEHDEDARAMLLSTDAGLIDKVQHSMDRLLPSLARREIIAASLNSNGALITVADLDMAAKLSNRLAPEHLQLAVQQPQALAKRIRHAGAMFLGIHAAEALGDYCAGPNHVLPTGRTARFSSPLGVYDFQKRTSIIQCGAAAAAALADIAARLAEAEGLSAHAASAALRRVEH